MDQRKVDPLEEAGQLRAARAQGLLDPIFRRLRDMIGAAEEPVEPIGAEWPYVRAFRDGELKSLLRFASWLDMRSKPSSDATKNTED